MLDVCFTPLFFIQLSAFLRQGKSFSFFREKVYFIKGGSEVVATSHSTLVCNLVGLLLALHTLHARHFCQVFSLLSSRVLGDIGEPYSLRQNFATVLGY